MDFFKKAMDKVESVVGDKDKEKEKSKDKSKDSSHSEQPSYGQPSHGQGYQSQGYGGPPAPNSYTAPPLPPGWISQWDSASQRTYYLEQSTGRTQWEMPHGGPLPYGAPPLGGYDAQAMHGPQGGYQGEQYGSHGEKEFKEDKKDEGSKDKKKDKGSGDMMKGAAGGLAVGAIGGGLIGHAMGDDSDDDKPKTYTSYQQQPAYGGQPGYGGQPQYYQEGPPPPAGDHSSVSSSDKEDLAEAREEYENASASDKEEAREEYEEQYEETYESD